MPVQESDLPEPLLRLRRSGIPTGLLDLDSLTHGLLPSTLWVIAGTPGAGCSMLAAQLARRAALPGGASTRFVSGREDRELVLTYWLAGEARVPLHHLLAGDLSPEEATRLEGAQRRLEAAPVAVWTEADDEWVDEERHSTASFRHQVGSDHQRARVIVADDVDVMLDAPLLEVIRSLRHWTRRANFTLIVTVPDDQVLDDGRLLPEVAREADVVVHIRRQDQFTAQEHLAGDARLDVLRNRYGPVARLDVEFQGFYAKFQNLEADRVDEGRVVGPATGTGRRDGRLRAATTE